VSAHDGQGWPDRNARLVADWVARSRAERDLATVYVVIGKTEAAYFQHDQ
jgi:hypothetical protein